MTNKQHPAQFDWATELLDARGHVTLSAKEAHEIGARLRSMGEIGTTVTNQQVVPDALRLATYIEEMANELALTHYTDDMDNAAAELRRLHARITELKSQLSSSGFTAADMATAAADGFRDGVAHAGETVAELETLRAENETLTLYKNLADEYGLSIFKDLEDLGGAADDVQLLRMGYAAARLEIESLRARSVASAGEYPLPGRTTDELMESQRESAIAAYRAAHGHDPDFGFAPDRSWIEGAAYVDADRAMRAAQQTGADYAALQEPFGWVKNSEIASAKQFGGSINLWRKKFDCDVPVFLTPQQAPTSQPAHSGEPVAKLVQAAQAFVLDQTSLQKKLYLEAQAGTPCRRNPFYHGPRNCIRGTVGCCEDHGTATQAQAGAVPLTDEQIESLLWKYGYDTDDTQMAAMLKEAHGIKGGQQ